LLAALAAACSGDDASGVDEGTGGSGGGELLALDDGARTDNSDSFHSAGEAPGAVPPVAGEAASGTNAGDAAQLPSLLDRTIIRTATVSLETGDVAANFENVGNIALGAGGFVSSSSFGNSGEKQSASITIRVPGDRYQDVLAQLRRLGQVREEQSSANDVTEQYTDLQSRLRNLQATEQRYLDLLARANTIDEILTVQDRLGVVRAEIETVVGRIQLLDDQTDLATVTVHLAPPAVAPKTDDGASNPLEVAQEAFEASLVVLGGIAAGALAVAAFSWWLVPLAVAGFIDGRRQLRQRETTGAGSP
jgi:hypothetical protein